MSGCFPHPVRENEVATFGSFLNRVSGPESVILNRESGDSDPRDSHRAILRSL